MGKEVEPAYPNRVLAVAIYDSNTTDVRGINHTPPGMVVVEQSFKIGYIYGTVITRLDVITTVVSAIFCHSEIADKGKTLRMYEGEVNSEK